MKKLISIVITILVLTVAAFAVLACDGSNEIESISIDVEDYPRTQYVCGEEFDPMGGKITIKTKSGNISKLSLEDPKVSIEGFDPEVEGNQELTISYEGKTTTLTVTLSKRIAVQTSSPYDLNYFVGESFNPGKAKMIVRKTYDTVSEVPLSEATIEGPTQFTSAGKVPLTVKYDGYEDTFNVTVYEVGYLGFTSPQKLDYQSHEAKLDLGGGFFTFNDPLAEENKPGGFTKTVNLNESMIDEDSYSFAAATFEDNRGNNPPAKQTVKVSYAGYEKSFPIQIHFSPVSEVLYYSDRLTEQLTEEEFDWEAEDSVVISNDSREIAFNAADVYFTLSEEDADYIPGDKVSDIMRIAAIASYDEWFNKGFAADENGNYIGIFAGTLELGLTETGTAGVTLKCDTYERARQSLNSYDTEAVKDLNTKNARLWKILDRPEFSSLHLWNSESDGELKKVTIRDYCTYAVDQKIIDDYVNQVKFLCRAYESIEDVKLTDILTNGTKPSEDETEAYEEIGTKIKNTYSLIKNSDYFVNLRPLFGNLSDWRSDYYDVIYQYYWNEIEWRKEGTVYDSCFNALLDLGWGANLPIPVEAWYEGASSVVTIMYEEMENDENGNRLLPLDCSTFYALYFNILDSIKKINDGNNDLYKDLMDNMGYYFQEFIDDGITENYVYGSVANQLMEVGMMERSGAMYDMPEFEEWAREYSELIIALNDGSFDPVIDPNEPDETPRKFSDKFYQMVPEFFNNFFNNYTTDQQLYFLNAICPQSPMIYILNKDKSNNEVYTLFTWLLVNYYNDVLDEETMSAFSSLLDAYENFLRREIARTDSVEDSPEYLFFNNYDEAYAKYINLNEDQKAEISFLYDKVEQFRDLYDADNVFKPIEVEEYWVKKLQGLADLESLAYREYITVEQGFQSNMAFLAICENALKSYDEVEAEIKALNDGELKTKLYNKLHYQKYDLLKDIRPGVVESCLSGTKFGIRKYFMDVLIGTEVSYKDNDETMLYGEPYNLIRDHIIEGYKFIEPFIMSSDGNPQYSDAEQDRQYMDDYIAHFLGFGADDWLLDEKVVFIDAQGYDVFWESMVRYVSHRLNIAPPESSPTIISKFVDVVYAWIMYQQRLNYYSDTDSQISKLRETYRSELGAYNDLRSLNTAQADKVEEYFGRDLVNIYKQYPTPHRGN